MRQAAPAMSTPIRFGPESILGDEAPQRPRAPMLRVALDARPERELIPGAVVTVVVERPRRRRRARRRRPAARVDPARVRTGGRLVRAR